MNPMGALDDICLLLASGKNVVSTAVTALIYPASMGAAESSTSSRPPARQGGTSFHATGIEPGWAAEVLPLTMSGLFGRIDSLLVQELLDYSTYDSADMLFDIMGFGRAPDAPVPTGRSGAGRLDVPGVADAGRRRARRHHRRLRLRPRVPSRPSRST